MRTARVDAVVQVLEEIAPLELAEEWDNVGLLVEPTRRRTVRRVLLTVDLTEPVLDEAIEARAELIVAYHPPIFTPLPRLTTGDVKQRVVLRCIEAAIAVHSPHTALDAATGGVNDWLADGFGPAQRVAIQPPVAAPPTNGGAAVGQGRDLVLRRPVGLPALVRRLKKHLGLPRLQLSTAPRHREGAKIATVALCAGAGSSVLRDLERDLLLTGEMGHHDVLAAVAGGTSVILAGHTNTERGYLEVLRERLLDALPSLDVAIATTDRHPLDLV